MPDRPAEVMSDVARLRPKMPLRFREYRPKELDPDQLRPKKAAQIERRVVVEKPRWSKHPEEVLTEVLKLEANGLTYSQIAKRCGLTRSTVAGIVRRYR